MTAALALILPRYFGQTQTFEKAQWLVDATSHLPYPDLHPHLYWAAFKLVNYGLLPALCIHFVLKQRIRDFGLRFVRDFRTVYRHIRIVALGSSRRVLVEAVKLGATAARPRSTPRGRLAELVARLARPRAR